MCRCAGLPADQPGIETSPFSELLARTDAFIFEFGLATQRDDEPIRTRRCTCPLDEERLKVVERLFREAASPEEETRPKRRRLARRFVGVDVIFTPFWLVFTDYIAANINPFAGHVLAGVPRGDS